MLNQNSHALINEQLLPKQPKKSSVWINFQLVYTMVNTLLSTYYDTSTEITDTLELEPTFLNTAWQAAIAALMMGLVLSFCQGKCYRATSNHFDAPDAESDLLEDDDRINSFSPKNRLGIKALAFTHFLAEVNSDIQPLAAFGKLAELDLQPWQWGLAYLAVTTYSLAGNMLDLLTTYSALKEEAGDTQTLSSQTLLERLQFMKNFINTFLKTHYTIGSSVTDSLELPASFLGIAWQGYVAALLPSIFFALCESKAHDAESTDFMLTPNSEPSDSNSHSLTKTQHLYTYGHFASDCVEGLAAPLATGKLLGLASLSTLPKVGIYGCMGIYSFFGNVQEYKNTQNAFKHQNQQTARANSLASPLSLV
jgi:hypothetical protein